MMCFIVFLDIENIWFDTRIKSLAEILRKLWSLFNLSAEQLTAILFYAHTTFSPRVPVWHSTDSGSGRPSEHESIIKVCKYHKTTSS